MNKLFIHICLWVILSQLSHAQNTKPGDWQEDGEILKLDVDEIPSERLNDPQRILTKEVRDNINYLISAHDMKSALPLYIHVLSHDQELLMEEYEIKSSLKHQFREKNALVVFYFYGYAPGAKGYVIIDGEDPGDDWEVNELFHKSAQDASVEAERAAEFESFIRELSKRSYWLEQRLMPPVTAEKNTDSNNSNNLSYWSNWVTTLQEQSSSLIIITFPLLAGAFYFTWSRKWRKYVLPSTTISERHGARYGANVSNPIEFSDPAISLTEQYEKIKSKEL